MYNNEHYPDPTAHEAIKRIEKDQHRPLVYICSPFSGDTVGNAERARAYSRYAVDHGAIPITPHLLYPQFLDDTNPRDRQLGLRFGLILLDRCSQIWVFGTKISKGMKKELNHAKKKHKKIIYIEKI